MGRGHAKVTSIPLAPNDNLLNPLQFEAPMF